jgi:hypothetical protein
MEARKAIRMRWFKSILLVWLICLAQTATTQTGKQFPKYPGPFLRESKTVIAIAELILRATEGNEFTDEYRPLRAAKIDGRWFVQGPAEDPSGELRCLRGPTIVFEPITCRIAYYGLEPIEFIRERFKGKALDRYVRRKDLPKSRPSGRGQRLP